MKYKRKILVLILLTTLLSLSCNALADQLTILSGPFGSGITWDTERGKINSMFTEIYGWGDHSQAGYLTSFTETDPLFTAWDKDYSDLINLPTIPTNLSELTNDPGFISSYTETDPTVNALGKVTLPCTSGQIPKYNGTTWECADDNSSGGTGDLVSTNNLSDIANAATALANLGGQPTLTPTTDVSIRDMSGSNASFKKYNQTRETGDPETSTSFYEAFTNGNNKVTLTVPSSLAGDNTITIPAKSGTIALMSDVSSGPHNVNLIQFKNEKLTTIDSGSNSGIYIATGVQWTAGRLDCNGTTITGLVFTIEHAATPDGTYTSYGTVSAEGDVTVSGYTDITAGTWVRARVSSVSTGDATVCWLPFTLTNN